MDLFFLERFQNLPPYIRIKGHDEKEMEEA
jgi:hypothetical protein